MQSIARITYFVLQSIAWQ